MKFKSIVVAFWCVVHSATADTGSSQESGSGKRSIVVERDLQSSSPGGVDTSSPVDTPSAVDTPSPVDTPSGVDSASPVDTPGLDSSSPVATPGQAPSPMLDGRPPVNDSPVYVQEIISPTNQPVDRQAVSAIQGATSTSSTVQAGTKAIVVIVVAGVALII